VACPFTIGKGATIGGNVWLAHSVPPGSHVLQAQMRHTTVESEHVIEAIYQPRI
jgi:serine acetyltransferase